MRPLRLELEGFTVYKKPQVIDFEKLDFFVIQGKTGAGKTSIVDAITFALYGKVPRYGGSTATKYVISKGSNRLRVALDFFVGGKRYRIERFYREKPREDTVRVMEEGRRLNLKKKEIEEKWVPKVTGLDYRTFTKVILLPQGEFDRFLKPSQPRERREILINLLNLEVFEKVRQLASEVYKELEGELTTLRSEYESLKEVSEGDIRRLEDEKREKAGRVEALRKRERELEELLNKARERESLERELEDILRKLRELEGRSEEIEKERKRLEVARKILPFLPYLERLEALEEEMRGLRKEREKLLKDRISLEEEIKNAEEERDRIEKEFRSLPEMRRRLQETLRELDNLERTEQELLEIKDKEEEIKRLEEMLREKEEILRDREERLKKGETYIEETERELEGLDFDEEEYERLLQEVERRRLLLEERERLQSLERELEEIEREKGGLEKELASLRSDLEEKDRKLKEESIRFYAQKIRSHLHEGDTCPVCGGVFEGGKEEEIGDLTSLEEEIGALRERVLEKEKELSSLRSKEESLKKEIRGLRSKLKGWEALLEMDLEVRLRELEGKKRKKRELEEKLKKYRERFNLRFKEREEALRDVQTIRSRIEDLRRIVGERREKLGNFGDLEGIRERRERLLEEAKELEERIEGVEKERERVKGYMEELARSMVALETKLREVEESLKKKEAEKKEVGRKLVPLFKELGDLERVRELQLSEEEIKEIEERISEFEKEREVLTESAKKLKERIEDLKGTPGSHEVEEELSKVRSEVDSLLRRLGEIERSIEHIKEIIEKKKRMEGKIGELEKELLLYSRLKEDLKSDRLQDFVSSLMLSRVVDRASEYLFNFTNTYELVIDSKGDLAVLDRVQGVERDVKSLSGGETFLASLSLALGVSDVLSANAHLESLFIDEGFGSLDEETRERVSDILELLRQRINRMVGIISHIPDLAERFHQRIIVKKHGDFSTVEVHY